MSEEKKNSEGEKPLIREEVLKLVEEHGGPEGLDLSGRNLEGIDLSGKPGDLLDLYGIILVKAKLAGANLQEAHLSSVNLQAAHLSRANLQGSNLISANLQGANLISANLQKAYLVDANLQKSNLWNANLQGADLWDANLQEANLSGANLRSANFWYANLQGANLRDANLQEANLSNANLSKTILENAKITYDTRLESVDWGPKYILGDEDRGKFKTSENVYRTLKQWHTQAGMYNIADQFHYREWAVIRKGLRWRKKPLQKLWNWVFYILCGYGGRPERVIIWAAVIISVLAGIYSSSTLSLLDSFYHSAVSFTALGYGLGATTPDGWVKGLGAFEAFIGVFMMALFLITFVRKMVR